VVALPSRQATFSINAQCDCARQQDSNLQLAKTETKLTLRRGEQRGWQNLAMPNMSAPIQLNLRLDTTRDESVMLSGVRHTILP
jgi:hypothetical protein